MSAAHPRNRIQKGEETIEAEMALSFCFWFGHNLEPLLCIWIPHYIVQNCTELYRIVPPSLFYNLLLDIISPSSLPFQQTIVTIFKSSASNSTRKSLNSHIENTEYMSPLTQDWDDDNNDNNDNNNNDNDMDAVILRVCFISPDLIPALLKASRDIELFQHHIHTHPYHPPSHHIPSNPF